MNKAISLAMIVMVAGCGNKKSTSTSTAGSNAGSAGATAATAAADAAPAADDASSGSDVAAGAGSGAGTGAGSGAGSGAGTGAGAGAGSGAGAGAAAGAGSAAAPGASTDPCGWVPRDDLEKAGGPWSTEPTPVPVTASVLGGCTYELANRSIVIELHPKAELATLVGKDKTTKPKGFPAHTTAVEDQDKGDAIVTFDDKPYLLRVHSDAGDRNPTSVLSVAIAKVLAPSAK